MFEGRLIKTDRKGKVSYHRNIISSIVSIATSEIDAVFSGSNDNDLRLCKIEFDGDNVYVDVFIKIKHGHSVSDVAYRTQENIKRGVDTMTSFIVKEVNVHVVDVVFN